MRRYHFICSFIRVVHIHTAYELILKQNIIRVRWILYVISIYIKFLRPKWFDRKYHIRWNHSLTQKVHKQKISKSKIIQFVLPDNKLRNILKYIRSLNSCFRTNVFLIHDPFWRLSQNPVRFVTQSTQDNEPCCMQSTVLSSALRYVTDSS